MIPTDYRSDAGFSVAGEPIEAVPIGDEPALIAAVERAIETGNPSIPSPAREKIMEPTALEKKPA